MQANQSPSINRQRMTRALVVCFILTVFFILVSSAFRGRGSQGASQIKLSVESGRPVAEAILKLEEKYGWVITYEDPLYVHESEIADVALKVRKDLDKYKPGEVPPLLVPRGGVLEFTYDVAPNTNLPPDPVTVVQKLLDAHAASSSAGRFRLESDGKIIHVIPTAMKNREGVLVPQESVLDTIISLPAEDRTIDGKLRSICAALSRATNMRFVNGTLPTPWFYQDRDQQGATNQSARDILVKTFEAMDDGTNLSWRLLYDPEDKTYVLNVHLVSKRQS